MSDARTIDRQAAFADSGIRKVIDRLDRELVGPAPVMRRIREIAALLLVDKLRVGHGLGSETPRLHMSFAGHPGTGHPGTGHPGTGHPGTGKTTAGMKTADILHRPGYIRSNHTVTVARDDLAGQHGGHTASNTDEALKKAMARMLFIGEACHPYRPENERDFGQEAIEILLEVVENRRDDLVVILAGRADRVNRLFASNPGSRFRIAHHVDFPGHTPEEPRAIAGLMPNEQTCRFSREAFRACIKERMSQPHVANTRSLRNALDRARLRQATRLFETTDRALTVDDLVTIEAPETMASRVFKGGIEAEPAEPRP